jgi:hypothetical protein
MVTNTTNAEDINTAITSWSGFVYQGKAALFHVLSLIVADRAKCRGYSLQLDYFEDFAVLSDKEIVSLHQVKAKKVKTYSGYSADVAKLRKKAADQKCSQAYFHVAQNITNKTPDEVEKEAKPVKLYKYDPDFFCNVDKIDQKIESKLQELWKGHPVKSTSEYAMIARHYLDQIILGQLFKIHSIIQDGKKSETEAANDEVIPFASFLAVLDEPDIHQKDQNSNYWLYILLDDMHQYYGEFCVDHEDEISEEEGRKLYRYMQAIRNLDVEQITQFIKNICPQRKTAFATLADYKNAAFNKEEFRIGFLTTLQALIEAPITTRNLIQWDKDGDSYFPTTIAYGASGAKEICKQILENFKDNDLEVLFERSNLITSDINIPSIIDAAPNVLSTEGMPETADIEHKISKMKKVSLVCRNTALGKLND